MRGLMMDFPLTVPALLERAGGVFGRVEIVTRRPDRRLFRSSWSQLYRRSRRLANALKALGLRHGDRVATLLWNQSEHMEAYFAVPSAGAVLHTLNLRLHPEELAFIVNHAGDRFLIVDDVLLPVFEKIRDKVNFERIIVVPFGGGDTPAGAMATRICWPPRVRNSPTRRSMKMTRRRCATRPGQRGVPKAWSTRTARWSFTPWIAAP